ncbi:MAG: MFS transporter [Hyphomonadaceae bacterium JAD_PAG50586_4]|nr:MAG: MFS transporter [Hyphomonadaceae bacterium JAD_PAG50586_4]
MTTIGETPRRFPRAAPNGLIASVLLAFLATAGLFYVNIMSAIVAGVADGLGVSEQQAGWVGSANIYGAAAGALVAVFIVKHIPWRPVAIAALLVLIALDVGSSLIRSIDLLVGMRFLHGLIGGGLVGVAFGVVSRTRSPDRVFGMLLAVQFGLGGLGVMLLPPLAPIYGTQALFFALAAFSGVTLLMVPFLDDYPLERKQIDVSAVAANATIRWAPLIATLFAVFLFQAGNMALGAYIFGVGRGYGLETPFIGAAVGWATWIGILGCLFVIVLGVRFGRTLLMAAAMVLTLVGTLAFHWSANPIIFVAANIGTAITWSFVISYLLGMSAEFDHAGRTAAMAGFASKMGLATGPFLGGALITEHVYGPLINASALVLALSTIAMLWPAAQLDKARIAAPNATDTP